MAALTDILTGGMAGKLVDLGSFFGTLKLAIHGNTIMQQFPRAWLTHEGWFGGAPQTDHLKTSKPLIWLVDFFEPTQTKPYQPAYLACRHQKWILLLIGYVDGFPGTKNPIIQDGHLSEGVINGIVNLFSQRRAASIDLDRPW